MPSDGEITFADHAGRFYARRYGMAPMVGRLLGYLAVCDPHEQSVTELADALLASRSAIAGAVNTLESLGLIRRSRAAGERMDRVRIDMSSPRATGFDLSEYQEQGELAREGLRLLADAPPEIQAEAKYAKSDTPMKLVQWVRFGGGAFIRFVGVARADAWAQAFPKFRAVRDGVKPRV